LTGLTNTDTGKRYRAKFERSGWNTVRSSVATLTVPLDAITVTQQPSNTTATTTSFATNTFSLPAGRWNRVSVANGRWFATPSNIDFGGDYIATSVDGINWTRTNLSLPAADAWSEVLYYDGVYLTYRPTTSAVSPRYATSTDGVTWTARTSTVLTNAIGGTFFAIVVHSGVGFVVISSQAASSTAGAVSSDGVTWAARAGGVGTVWYDSLTVGNRTVLATYPIFTGAPLNREQFGVATVVADGSPAYTAITNTNPGESYNVRLSTAGDYIVHTLSINNGPQPRLLSYADASATTPTVVSLGVLPNSNALLAVLPGSPRWVAVGNSGFYTSSDQGQTWALRQSTTFNVNGNGRLYVSGNRISFTNFPSTSTIHTSDDGGLSWATRTFASSGTVGPTQVGSGRIVWQLTPASVTHQGTIIDLGGAVSATFSSSATTTFGAPAIQWQTSTDNGATWTDIAGATASPLSLNPAAGDNGRRYRARFTKSGYTEVNTNAAILTVP
jgi:hypothetical protein